MRWLTSACLLVSTACAHGVSPRPPLEHPDAWREWSGRVDALPRCLPMEFADLAPEGRSLAPGETVHVRGTLGLIESRCEDLIRELVLRGRALPDANTDAMLSLPELNEAVARSQRGTCGSALGLRAGDVEYALEAPYERVWRENEAELFDALLGQTDAIVLGVVEGVAGSQVLVRADRVCRGSGPPLIQPRPPDTGERWKLFDGLEHLATITTLPRPRRAQALRVLFDLTVSRDQVRARRAAERLASEFSERSRLDLFLRPQ